MCDAAGCDGGMVQVSTGWVDKQMAKLPPGLPTEMVRSKRAGFVDTWYPCRECRPGAFTRWVHGHWRPDHDVASCDECKAMGATPRPTRRSSGPTRMQVETSPPTPPPHPAIDPGEDF